MELAANWTWDFIHISPVHVCLIDETRSKVSDPSWQNDVLPSVANIVRYSNSAIFYCASSQTASKAQVLELIQVTFWFPFYCAFVSDDAKVY